MGVSLPRFGDGRLEGHVTLGVCRLIITMSYLNKPRTFSRPVIQGTFLEDRACVVTANAAFYNNSTKQEYFVI